MYRHNGFLDLLAEWIVDRFFDWYDAKFGKKKAGKEFAAIKIVPNTDPDRFYHDWLRGSWMVLNELPEAQLTVTQCEKPINEIVQVICGRDPLVIHTGRSEESCPGVALSEGLKALFSGQPSTWQIRIAMPGIVERPSPNLGALELFLAQEFEGSVPGSPNRDICNLYLGRNLGPMELEIRIPHYGVCDGYCKIAYLKVDLKIDPVMGVIVTGHEDNMDSRPR